MATGQLEVWPWQDSTLRGGASTSTLLASFEQVLSPGLRRDTHRQLPGHMEWALLDLPGVGGPDRVRDASQLRDSQVRRSGDLHVRSDEIWRERGDGRPADAPIRDYRRTASGETRSSFHLISCCLRSGSGGRSARAQARRSECPSMPMLRSRAANRAQGSRGAFRYPGGVDRQRTSCRGGRARRCADRIAAA